MTYGEWLPRAAAALREAGILNPALEAQVLAAHARGVERSVLLAHPEWEVDEKAEPILTRRLDREPLAYILGYREFYGRRFAVTRDVLVPRQETETLVGACLQSAALESARTLLDLGTGSGCIGITIKLEAPQLKVTLAEISPAALSIASKNAEILGAEVELVGTDGFQNLGGRKFDLIVRTRPMWGWRTRFPRKSGSTSRRKPYSPVRKGSISTSGLRAKHPPTWTPMAKCSWNLATGKMNRSPRCS